MALPSSPSSLGIASPRLMSVPTVLVPSTSLETIVGERSAAQKFTIRNTGVGDLTGLSVSVSGRIGRLRRRADRGDDIETE